jgi:ABC-type multidrug transport system ATPase subunit
MEEAEGLCDRIGIFVDGQLRCIGTSSDLTRRFGGIYILTVTVTDLNAANEENVSALVHTFSPKKKATYVLNGTLKYELPSSDTRLSQVFETLLAAKAEGLISSWGITSCTLEDVFIKISQNSAPSTNMAPQAVASAGFCYQ